MFTSSIKRSHPQPKAHSLLAINLFVGSAIQVWRWRAVTILSPAMNAYICSVKSRSEVSSRNCLVASNKLCCLLYRNWFRNPSKTETRGKKFLKKNSISSRNGPMKRTETRQRWKNSRTPPTTEWWQSLVWSPTRNERTQEDYPTSAAHFCICTVVFLRSLIPGWRLERRPPSCCSRWCSWVFSSLPCFCPFYTSIPTRSCFQKLFSHSIVTTSVLFPVL